MERPIPMPDMPSVLLVWALVLKKCIFAISPISPTSTPSRKEPLISMWASKFFEDSMCLEIYRSLCWFASIIRGVFPVLAIAPLPIVGA